MPQFDTTHPLAWLWTSSLGFALTHSLLASRTCKRIVGLSPQHYRLAFTTGAVVTTFAWLGFVHMLPDTLAYRLHGTLRIAGHALQLVGIWMLWRAARAFDMRIFLGLAPMPEAGEPFLERGIYRHLRHPMYTGALLILLTNPVQSVNHLHLAAAVALYFIIGSRLEEARMLAEHPEYAGYRRRVPAFLPRLGGPRG